MRSGILLLFVAWTLAALWAYVKTKGKSEAATQAALYLVCYPIVISFAVANKPLPAIIVSPLVMAGIPWLAAGIHLSKVLKDPSIVKPGDFIGLPAKFWLWGLAISLAIPLILMK